MTVLQLKRKLNKLPDDAVVIINNDRMRIEGDYIATGIELWEKENLLEITTDYKKRIGE